MTDTPPWLPCPITMVMGLDDRDPVHYRAVCMQFGVEHSPRYRAQGTKTFCNIYVWDCTRSCECEIPHWYDDRTGAPVQVGKGREMNANAMLDWLLAHGPNSGWSEVDETIARLQAANGHPTVAIWKNDTGGPGHVAMVLPNGDDGTHIAQAGARNYFGVALSVGFGGLRPRFFTHR